MAEVLVVVDHVDGAVRKPTLELLTIARRLGEPSAVFLGQGAANAQAVLAEYGAARVYVVDAPEIDAYLVTPKVDALTQIARIGHAVQARRLLLQHDTKNATAHGLHCSLTRR